MWHSGTSAGAPLLASRRDARLAAAFREWHMATKAAAHELHADTMEAHLGWSAMWEASKNQGS